MSNVLQFDQAEVDRMVRWARSVGDGKVVRKSMRAGFRGLGAPFAREMRRLLKSHGLSRATSLLVKSITTVLVINKKTGDVKIRVGARNRKVAGQNPSKYFHLYDQGTEPHLQPNAYRLINSGGRKVLVKIRGGARHPGSRPHPVRDPAARKAAPEMFDRFGRRFYGTVERELKKQSQK